MQRIKLLFLFISCYLFTFSQSNLSYRVVSSSNGGLIKDIIIASNESKYEIVKDLVDKLMKNRSNGDTLNIYLENKKRNSSENLKEFFDCPNIKTIECYSKPNNFDITIAELNNKAFAPINISYLDSFDTLIDANAFKNILNQSEIDITPKRKNKILKKLEKNKRTFYKINTQLIERKDTFNYKETKTIINNYFKCEYESNLNVYFFNSNNKNLKQNVWVQDLLIPVYNDTLIKCFYKKSKLVDSLSNVGYISKEKVDFHLEGGNVLFLDSNTAFIGKNSTLVRDSSGKIDSIVYNEILKTFGLDTIYFIGYDKTKKDVKDNFRWQPFFHIDLYITPIKIKDTVHTLVGKVYDIVSSTDSSFLYHLNLNIDSIAYQLKNKGFQVHRIPIGFQNHNYFSFNNMFLETIRDSTFAYIPHYNNIIPDSLYYQFELVMHKLKIKPIFINKNANVFVESSYSRGSLHCLINILSRKED